MEGAGGWVGEGGMVQVRNATKHEWRETGREWEVIETVGGQTKMVNMNMIRSEEEGHYVGKKIQ